MDERQTYSFVPICPRVVAVSQTTHSLSAKAQPSKDQELISLNRDRATELAAGDRQGWAKYVSADFRFLEGKGSGNRDSVVKECEDARSTPAGYKQERILSDLHVQSIGETRAVDCLYETVEHFGDGAGESVFKPRKVSHA